jgi:hypothetical protein
MVYFAACEMRAALNKNSSNAVESKFVSKFTTLVERHYFCSHFNSIIESNNQCYYGKYKESILIMEETVDVSSSEKKNALPNNITIKQGLSPDDVLLGRGTGSNEHEGNIRFRATVMGVLRRAMLQRKAVSDVAPCSKSAMATSVLSLVHQRGGQFVRKLSKAEAALYSGKKTDQAKKVKKPSTSFVVVDPGPLLDTLYVVVPREVALEKAKQSFRHQQRVLQLEQERSDNRAGEVEAARQYTAHGQDRLPSSSILRPLSAPRPDDTSHPSTPRILSAFATSMIPQSQAPQVMPSLPSTIRSTLLTKYLMEGGSAAVSASRQETATQNADSVLSSLMNRSPAATSLPVSALSVSSSSPTDALIQTLKRQQEIRAQRAAILLAAYQRPLAPPPANTPTALHTAVEQEISNELLVLRLQQQRLMSSNLGSGNSADGNHLLSEAIAWAAALQR